MSNLLEVIDKKKLIEYIEKLDKIEENNEWLPSPHAIKPYVDYAENRLLFEENHSQEAEELYDRITTHWGNAYEE